MVVGVRAVHEQHGQTIQAFNDIWYFSAYKCRAMISVAEELDMLHTGVSNPTVSTISQSLAT